MDHSVLYNFRKLFETPSYHRLFSYLEELKIIYPLQVAIRDKCVTTHVTISTSGVPQEFTLGPLLCSCYL